MKHFKTYIPVTLKSLPYKNTSSAVNSDNWSGYFIPATTSQQFVETVGTWINPEALSCPSNQNTAVSMWTGVGGWNSSALIQAGTQTDTTTGLFGCSSLTYAWWEILLATETEFTNIAINQADTMYGVLR